MRALPCVDVGAAADERGHRPRVAGARAGHQHGLAVQQRRVRVGAGVEQPLDHRRAAVGAGQMQRRRAAIVGGARARAGADQQIGDREIVAVRRPVQCGRAVAGRRVDVDWGPSGLQQRAHGLDISAFGRLDQALVDCSRRRHARGHEHDSNRSAALQGCL